MAKHSQNEVKESLKELTRIFQPKDPRKFVKEYVRKYRITGGYEDELTSLVEDELGRMNSSAVQVKYMSKSLIRALYYALVRLFLRCEHED